MILNLNINWLVLSAFGMFLGAGVALFFERKLIAMSQKRLGISFIGRNGWLHLPADVFKFWIKSSTRHVTYGSAGILGILCCLLGWNIICSIFFLTNTTFSFFDFWSYQLLYYLAYNSVSSMYLSYVIISLRSKYSTIAALRVILLNIFLEIPMVFLFLIIYFFLGDYSFDAFSQFNNTMLLFAPIIGLVLLIYILFESKRAPFDHTEAESELVAGHLIEFGGRTLLIFFMCEYVHVFFAVYFIITLILGHEKTIDVDNLHKYLKQDINVFACSF